MPEKNKIKVFFKKVYEKLFLINDTPQRIALGFGIGIFAGILPGTGPVAAIFLALALKANRASALIGSLLTNTWLSFVTFLSAIKVGSFIFNTEWHKIKEEWFIFLKDFHWANLFKISLLKIGLPVIVGYVVIALVLGIASYLVIFLILSIFRRKR
ncbi:MAG: DUF2062 domain-containing protein [Candidatus Omnitrophica bacterium]|nr:DUF2062 domain-containing protein [Candidatus Omnitrophota bacterium]